MKHLQNDRMRQLQDRELKEENAEKAVAKRFDTATVILFTMLIGVWATYFAI